MPARDFVRRFTKTLCEQPGFRRLGLEFSGLMWLVVTSALLGFSANAATGLLGELVPSFGEFAVKYEAIIEALLYPGDPILRVAAVACNEKMLPVRRNFAVLGVVALVGIWARSDSISDALWTSNPGRRPWTGSPRNLP